MKLLGIVAALGLSMAACSQDIKPEKVPSVVRNAVQAKFSNATGIEWEKKKDIFEAELTKDSVEYTVEVDATGKLLRQKTDVTVQQLPAAITQALQTNYSQYTVDDAEQLEVNGTTLYQLELEGKGVKDVKLVFEANGTVSKVAYWD